MGVHKVLLVTGEQPSSLGEHIQKQFEADIERDITSVPSLLSESDYKVVVFDAESEGKDLDFTGLKSLLKREEADLLPIVVISKAISFQDKIDALEFGCDDFIEPEIGQDEACLRITKSILHRVASDQLVGRLEMANKTVHSALTNSCALGENMQFLINVHDCDNLDQLGQCFFASAARFGLKCSLQLRGDYEVKNMEAHGMAKDLESQLLWQLKDSGRYVEFGARVVVNFNRVSLLIKNMPIDNSEQVAQIKDNVFVLLQGTNARVISLEDQCRLLEEREALAHLATDVRQVMGSIQCAFQKVMRDIADEVDNAQERVLMKIPSLSLIEEDEAFLDTVMSTCVKNTTRIFNEGLKVDEAIQRLDHTIDRSLEAADVTEEANVPVEPSQSSGKSASGVELF